MDFAELSDRDVLREESLDEYFAGIEFFQMQLYRLNTDLFILDKVVDFPFELFTGAGDNVFFAQVSHNLSL